MAQETIGTVGWHTLNSEVFAWITRLPATSNLQRLRKCRRKFAAENQTDEYFQRRSLLKLVTYGAAHFLSTGHKGVKRMQGRAVCAQCLQPELVGPGR